MSTNPLAAYYLLEGRLQEFSERLLSIPACPFWVHESVVARLIELPRGTEHGQSEALTALLACLKKGYGGNRKKGTLQATGYNAVDLEVENNEYPICFQKWGEKEEFERGTDSLDPIVRTPRWFKFCNDSNGIELKEQYPIVNELTGHRTSSTLAEGDLTIPRFAAKRRHKSYISFYKGDESQCTPYLNFDIPVIAAKFIHIWPEFSMNSDQIRRRSFCPDQLAAIEESFRLILAVSNVLGKGGNVFICNNKLCTRRSTREARVTTVRSAPPSAPTSQPPSRASSRPPSRASSRPPSRASSRPPSRGIAEEVSNARGGNDTPSEAGSIAPSQASRQSDTTASGGIPLHSALLLENLKCCDDDAIVWDMVDNLASIELMFFLWQQEDMSWDCIETEMKSRGAALPLTIAPSDLPELSGRNIANARRNIDSSRQELIDCLAGRFTPTDDEMLYEFVRDSNSYSEGCRLECDPFSLNPGNRQPQLSRRSAWILRHVYFSFNLPIYVIGSLWVSFYALIMNRAIPTARFAAATTIWNNTMALRDIDKSIESAKFWRAIRKKTKNGFQRYFYSSSDDSKHFKQNRHVLLISTFDDDASPYDYCTTPIDPTFRHVTSTPNNVKATNAKKNADDIIDLLGLEYAALYGGGCVSVAMF